MRRSRWLIAALAAVSLAACGGDDEPAEEDLRKPPLTVPQTNENGGGDATTDTTGTEPGSGGSGADGTDTAPPDEPLDQPSPDNGGTPAPDTNDPPADPPRDSPDNDTPPEAGSPEERFEQFCEQNPGAC